LHLSNKEQVTKLYLLVIIFIAAAFRLHNIDFGLPSLWDDDEPFFLMFGLKLIKNETLNPGWFGHPGTTTIYLISLCTAAVYTIGGIVGSWSNAAEFVSAIYARPEIIMVPQRVMIAIPGLISVWLTWRIGQRIHSAAAGLVAAAILALSPLHIELSQLIRTDVQMTMWILWCVYASLPLGDGYRTGSLIWSSLLAGIACATKWPGALILLVPVAFILVLPASWSAKLGRIALSLLCSAGALVLVSPYLLLDYRTVLANVMVEGRDRHLSQTSGGLVETLSTYLFDVMPNALGWPALLLATAGLMVALTSRSPVKSAIPIAVPTLAFLGLISLQSIMWPRWAVPMLPFLAIAAGIFSAALTERLATLNTRSRILAHLSVGLLVFAPLVVGARNAAVERSNDTRDLAVEWVQTHVPATATVAVETPAIALLKGPWPLRYPLGDLGCVDPRQAMAGHVDYEDVARATKHRININLSTIPSGKMESCRTDFVIVNELDRYSAEAGYYPEETANYRALLADMQEVAVFVPAKGKNGGPVVRIFERSSANRETAGTGHRTRG
jgi:hypothetical protein